MWEISENSIKTHLHRSLSSPHDLLVFVEKLLCFADISIKE